MYTYKILEKSECHITIKYHLYYYYYDINASILISLFGLQNMSSLSMVIQNLIAWERSYKCDISASCISYVYTITAVYNPTNDSQNDLSNNSAFTSTSKPPMTAVNRAINHQNTSLGILGL